MTSLVACAFLSLIISLVALPRPCTAFRMPSPVHRTPRTRVRSRQPSLLRMSASEDASDTIMRIDNVHAEVGEEEEKVVKILDGFSLEVKKGEVHAIMGPNGSGKSTLSKVITGHPDYRVIEGSITFKGEDVLDMDVDERALAGIFLAFQYPVEIAGVSNSDFLRAAVNIRRKREGLDDLDAIEFSMKMFEELDKLGLDPSFLDRGINAGFSGGEKKRNEVLQMVMLNPDLVILDETDSGLDVDSLKTTAEAVNNFKASHPDKTFLIITHYQRLLDLIKADRVSVMKKGRVVLTGGPDLATTIEQWGYGDWLEKEAAGGREAVLA
ncbi:unnamed protein product [Vitrella brassicaformis CCMP3155]|uniref:ABC transporter domain-containing protein n=1 Tax=Vitrella brassicaformis (strain CCMP3155) TaxID=1169540 RepID=A0A0G4GLU8_VITBC|nr:unnamed protein product [Vitrella brassicaformis CCMP3155]|eukprot:CEM31097.1 unnamed protein product [Vitrella brassicaformis CCMP3155]